MGKEKVYGVFGLGAFGSEICRVLAEKGAKVVAFDNQGSKIEKIKDLVRQAVLLDTTDEEALRSAPLEDIDVAVVAIGEDIESSILTTAILKKAGIPLIVARAVTDIHQRVLRQVGADEVVNLEIEEGRRVAARLLSPEILETLPVSADFSIVEIYPPAKLIGKTIQELDLRNRLGISVISIKRVKTSIDGLGNPVREEEIVIPRASDRFEENDILLVIGRNDDLEGLRDR